MIDELESDVPVAESPVPDIGPDLVAIEAEGYFEGIRVDRALATLELLRHQEITMEQAAILLGLSGKELRRLLERLPIGDFQRLAA
jgi:hypothetical protein